MSFIILSVFAVFLGFSVPTQALELEFETSYEDLNCKNKLESMADIAVQFSESPANTGIWIEDRMVRIVTEEILTLSAATISAYRTEACKKVGGTPLFNLESNAACSKLAASLWALKFKNKENQERFYASFKRLAEANGALEGDSWDQCPGFKLDELKKDRIKK